MPVTTTLIETYSVSAVSEGDPNTFFATVTLFNAAGATLAFLRFYESGVPKAANEFRVDLGYPLISYPASNLPAVVDLLRNEKPVYFVWYDYRPTRCFGAVSTSREPIGEAGA
jgi:hypothetical protein